MARSKADVPTRKSETKDEAVERIAKTVFDSIISNLPSGNFSAITEIATQIEPLGLTYAEAGSTFRFIENFLKDFAESRASEADAYTAERHISLLCVRAKEYFINRIANETKDNHVADILAATERRLEDSHISTYFHDALKAVKDGCEKKIERQRKRAKIRKDLKVFDEPRVPRSDVRNKKTSDEIIPGEIIIAGVGLPESFGRLRQGFYTRDQMEELDFARKKKIAELQVEQDFRATDSEMANSKKKANKAEGELTTEQVVIFFHYFFEVANVSSGLAAAKKIDVIQSVTRWSRNSVSNIIYDRKGGGIFRKANGDDYTTFEADMHAVKSLYQKLGLRDIVKMIDDDITDIDKKL